MSQLASAPNFRGVGGQISTDGRRVKNGVIYRSDAVTAPDQVDADVIRDLGIVLACDLRSESERLQAPNDWWRTQGVELLNLDLLRGIPHDQGPWAILRADQAAAAAGAAMRSVYAALPDASRDQLGLLFRRIAAGDVPLLIHCTAGKDRTGFVVAILLTALGVPADEVMDDYLASRGRYREEAQRATRAMLLARAGIELDDDALRVMMGVEEDYLQASFAVIERDYGGVEDYLAAAGVLPAELARVRARLLA